MTSLPLLLVKTIKLESTTGRFSENRCFVTVLNSWKHKYEEFELKKNYKETHANVCF